MGMTGGSFMASIIAVKDLTKLYGQQGAVCRALHEVSFEIEAGSFVAVMGPSGSGKTTLLNIISTIDKPTQGRVIIDSRDTVALREKDLAVFRRDVIGFVFQEFNLLDNMTIRDNIALPLTLNNIKTDRILSRVQELTALLGIDNQLNKYPYQLSGGQKQRAAVCRALVNEPKILFADEPTGALDSKAASELLACFRNIRNQYGTTVVMVTHDASAASYCDRVIFLKDGMISGKLETNGNAEEFFKKILNMVALLGGERNERLQNLLAAF
jgi:putative ABC transport system ATP-binding protein